jgi:hypothetical protein
MLLCYHTIPPLCVLIEDCACMANEVARRAQREDMPLLKDNELPFLAASAIPAACREY